MATVSPPKPWERAGAASALSSISPAIPSTTTTTSTTSPAIPSFTSTSDAPDLPSRPSTLNNVVNRTATNYSPYGANRLGSSPYGGGYGGMNSYSSPYSRLGGMGSMYGGMGGMGGGMYGGMGGMYGGMGGGMPGDPNNPDGSLTNSFNQSTQATFQIIESIVGAFGGFAQMLESTYMATHSSFFAMVSVAEQFGNLRNTLGSVLGIFTILRWIRTLMAKLTGRPPPVDATSLTPSAFAAFTGAAAPPATLPDGSPAPPRPSKKPFIVFLVTVVGLPYLMGKLIKALARSQEEEARRQAQLHPEQQIVIGPNGEPMVQAAVTDPSKLDFCKVLYDYTPDTNSSGIDLAVKKGDLVAVLSRTDPMGSPSEWWRCRARNGQSGYLPSPYLEIVQRKQQAQITAGSTSQPGSRTQTMSSDVKSLAERTKSLKGVQGELGKPEVKGKVGDVTVESFQKSQFYS